MKYEDTIRKDEFEFSDSSFSYWLEYNYLTRLDDKQDPRDYHPIIRDMIEKIHEI